MNEESYIVIEGTHKNPNRIETLLEKSKKIYGPFSKSEAEEFAKGLIQVRSNKLLLRSNKILGLVKY